MHLRDRSYDPAMTEPDTLNHPQDVFVRPCGPADWCAVIELLCDVYAGGGFVSETRARKAYTPEQLSANGLMLIAHDATEILGAVVIVHPRSQLSQLATDSEAEFRLLAVKPESRGRGVGEQLVRACINHASTPPSTAERIVICTQPSMTAAQNLYKRLGFTREPVRDFVIPSMDPGKHPEQRLVYVHELNTRTPS